MSEFHINGQRLFTPDEDRFIVHSYATMTAPAMADIIGRPAGSVRSRIIHLRQQGRIFGRPYRAPRQPTGEKVGVRTTAAIQAEQEAVADEATAHLLHMIRHGQITQERAVALATRLRQHLNTRGSARLVNMPVLSIVDLLQEDS
jgi:hypothetical protein